MCEVNEHRDERVADSIQEDDALEKIFSECDVSSRGRVSVGKLIDYMRDHMPTQGSPEILKDLRKSMLAASYDGEVTRKEYYNVSRCWLAKIREHQQYHHANLQDGNNNLQVDRGRCETPESFFEDVSSFDDTSYHLAKDDSVAETTQDLRLRVHRCAVDNDHLREELQRAEDSIASLEKQLGTSRRKLELANNKRERLQEEHDEQKELLAATERNREALGARNQRLEREMTLLKKEIRATETEVRRLSAELDKANEQKEELAGLFAGCRQELIDGRALYEEARSQISQLERVNDQLRVKCKDFKCTTEHLKIVVKELETRIAELQSTQSYTSRGDPLFGSPDSENGLDSEAEISHFRSEKPMPRSLCDEMRDTGYRDPGMGQENETRTSEEWMMEEQELTYRDYVAAVREASEQLGRATTELAASRRDLGIEAPSQEGWETGNDKCDPDTEDLQIFKSQIRHAITILSLMASRKVTDADVKKEAATQVDLSDSVSEPAALRDIHAADIASYSNSSSGNFCSTRKRELHSHQEDKEGKRSLVKTESKVAFARSTEGSFLSPLDVSAPSSYVTSTPRSASPDNSTLFSEESRERAIIVPIVAALDEIIDQANGSSGESETAPSPTGTRREHNPRYIYTLPSRRLFESKDELFASGGDVHTSVELGAWRRRGSNGMDDSYEEQKCSVEYEQESLDSDSSNGGNSSRSMAHVVELTSVRNNLRITTEKPTSDGSGSDIVEILKSDLEKLTLTPAHADKTRDERENTIDVRNPQIHGRVPKRKSSVYRRPFDIGQGTAARRAARSDEDEHCDDSESSPKFGSTFCPDRLDEPDNPPSENNFTPEDIRRTAQESRERKNASPRDGLELHGPPVELGTPIPASPTRAIESEASLGCRRLDYVVAGSRSPPRPARPMPTPRLPSSDEILGDVGSVNSAQWRSGDREISSGSRSVARAMSSEEDSSDSECVRDGLDAEETLQVVAAPPPPPSQPLQGQPPILPPPARPSSLGLGSTFAFREPPPPPPYVGISDEGLTSRESELGNSKNGERLRRSLSESDCGSCRDDTGCRCRCGWSGARGRIPCKLGEVIDVPENSKGQETLRVFPSLPDARLIELGLAHLPNGRDLCERWAEDELERKYAALSVGLGTDRATLPRRLALSLRQRDQAERNLATEVGKMQRDVQALAPLCVDRESVERVERVRHQLEMISRCALRVSCTAELLGATHQERRVSRATLLADRYLQALRARCEKLAIELAETKRILTENNIVVEENPNEPVDDVVPRVRYRGAQSINRSATISRRRASIAAISRPSTGNPLQELTAKEAARQQRTSVSGRMTLRRPSLGYDMQKWDGEKLDRTDSSSSSIGELREIFEQAESRRGSKEENNNLIRSQSSNFSVGSCESGDSDLWTSTREDSLSCQPETIDEQAQDQNKSSSRGTPRVLRTVRDRVPRLPVLWYVLFVVIFFFGFYTNRYVSTRSAVPLKWWSLEAMLQRYVHVPPNVPPPL